MTPRRAALVLLAVALPHAAHADDEPAASEPEAPPSATEILGASPAAHWQAIPADRLVVMTLGDGSVVLIELASDVAPKNVRNIRTLVSEGYFDGLAIVRSHDNYVVQWADPNDETDKARPLGSARTTVPGEFDRPARALDLTPLPSADAYADTVGFVDGFPAASDGERTWLTHCYGMVGVARGNAHDSGNGSSLYVVTGHAPRHLDRNITLVGRVIDGIEALSSLPRGSGPLGFYTEDEATTPIASVRLASDLPEDARPTWERLRTDSPTFAALLDAKTNRRNPWFARPTGKIGLCNVPLARRERAGAD